MNYIIRKTKIEDRMGVMDAHKRSIQDLCSNDYNEDQISKWSNVNYSRDIWKDSIDNEYHLVVELNGKIEGLCHARICESGEGEIAGLYFTKEVAGRGIGREAFEYAMEYLKSGGASKVFIMGTLTAKGFYEKMGFVEVEKKRLEVRGTTLDCFKMEMNL